MLSFTSDDKVAAGVDVVLGVAGDVLLGDGGQDNLGVKRCSGVGWFSPTDLLHDVLPQGLQCDLLAVLGGDDHRVNPGGRGCDRVHWRMEREGTEDDCFNWMDPKGRLFYTRMLPDSEDIHNLPSCYLMGTQAPFWK